MPAGRRYTESQWSPWSCLREGERYTMLSYGDHIDSVSHGLAVSHGLYS